MSLWMKITHPASQHPHLHTMYQAVSPLKYSILMMKPMMNMLPTQWQVLVTPSQMCYAMMAGMMPSTTVRTRKPTQQTLQLPPNLSPPWSPITLPLHHVLLCQTPPHLLFVRPQPSWDPSNQACPSQNGEVSVVDPRCQSKLNSTHFCKHTVTSHSKLQNSAQRIQLSWLTALLQELRSRILNGGSMQRRIGLKSGTNSMLTHGGSTPKKA